jgi:uncharacterized protein YaeQ
MALTSTIHNFDVNLSNVDKGVYETLTFKVAQHPTETLDYMMSRVLAYCFEYEEGIAFGKGIGQGEEPPVWSKDLTGQIQLWVEVGLPDPDSLHRASKASQRLVVYTHRDPAILKRNVAGKTVHRGDAVMVYGLEPGFLRRLTALIDRRNAFDLSITEGQVFLSIGGETLETTLSPTPLQGGS